MPDSPGADRPPRLARAQGWRRPTGGPVSCSCSWCQRVWISWGRGGSPVQEPDGSCLLQRVVVSDRGKCSGTRDTARGAHSIALILVHSAACHNRRHCTRNNNTPPGDGEAAPESWITARADVERRRRITTTTTPIRILPPHKYRGTGRRSAFDEKVQIHPHDSHPPAAVRSSRIFNASNLRINTPGRTRYGRRPGMIGPAEPLLTNPHIPARRRAGLGRPFDVLVHGLFFLLTVLDLCDPAKRPIYFCLKGGVPSGRQSTSSPPPFHSAAIAGSPDTFCTLPGSIHGIREGPPGCGAFVRQCLQLPK
jgi:hypothetical protein